MKILIIPFLLFVHLSQIDLLYKLVYSVELKPRDTTEQKIHSFKGSLTEYSNGLVKIGGEQQLFNDQHQLINASRSHGVKEHIQQLDIDSLSLSTDIKEELLAIAEGNRTVKQQKMQVNLDKEYTRYFIKEDSVYDYRSGLDIDEVLAFKRHYSNIKYTGESRTIDGYICQKVTFKYFNRNFVAWFTEDIPLSMGPYIFEGFPGLILELYDTENRFNFRLQSIEKINAEFPGEDLRRKKKHIAVEDYKEVFYKHFTLLNEQVKEFASEGGLYSSSTKLNAEDFILEGVEN